MDLAPLIDHTLLEPFATAADIERLCAEALRYGFATVCVNPIHVRRAAAALRGGAAGICSVAGFPLGATTSGQKAAEAAEAVRHGATEIDMVIDLGALRAGDDHRVRDDVRAVVAAAGVPVKAIVESAALRGDELRRACEAALAGGAAFVKTSTGFHAAGGASARAVRAMRECVGGRAQVKASGGIRTRADAVAMIEAGAQRLGCSASVAIVTGAE
ncbi:MAG TPA: deoxyribose-phosphate aldolase [Candidatus Dormibacteraeota bacterium]|nr:deoxyribose-phosphate aldolase [Candidatus Dormibacteraeota bacterium]